MVRFVLHDYRPTSSVSDVQRNLQLETLKERGLKQRLTMIYRTVNNLARMNTSNISRPTLPNIRVHNLQFLQTICTTRF